MWKTCFGRGYGIVVKRLAVNGKNVHMAMVMCAMAEIP